MQRVAIDVAMHGYRANTHLFAGPDYPAGNLAAIGDQDLAKWSGSGSHRSEQQAGSSKQLHQRVGVLPPAANPSLGLDSEKRLAVFHRLPVFDVNLDDFAGGF